uniref:hypothetical protein RF2 n=1 Tax=Thonningia sanguinea TaxID=1618145 RepID=UPI0026E190D2|nr:hypothetical protein RF2 [Thonningia sanguinea]WJE89130.1 hypothetical protein RF2 [Thonningia sanguinea]
MLNKIVINVYYILLQRIKIYTKKFFNFNIWIWIWYVNTNIKWKQFGINIINRNNIQNTFFYKFITYYYSNYNIIKIIIGFFVLYFILHFWLKILYYIYIYRVLYIYRDIYKFSLLELKINLKIFKTIPEICNKNLKKYNINILNNIIKLKQLYKNKILYYIYIYIYDLLYIIWLYIIKSTTTINFFTTNHLYLSKINTTLYYSLMNKKNYYNNSIISSIISWVTVYKEFEKSLLIQTLKYQTDYINKKKKTIKNLYFNKYLFFNSFYIWFIYNIIIYNTKKDVINYKNYNNNFYKNIKFFEKKLIFLFYSNYLTINNDFLNFKIFFFNNNKTLLVGSIYIVKYYISFFFKKINSYNICVLTFNINKFFSNDYLKENLNNNNCYLNLKKKLIIDYSNINIEYFKLDILEFYINIQFELINEINCCILYIPDFHNNQNFYFLNYLLNKYKKISIIASTNKIKKIDPILISSTNFNMCIKIKNITFKKKFLLFKNIFLLKEILYINIYRNNNNFKNKIYIYNILKFSGYRHLITFDSKKLSGLFYQEMFIYQINKVIVQKMFLNNLNVLNILSIWIQFNTPNYLSNYYYNSNFKKNIKIIIIYIYIIYFFSILFLLILKLNNNKKKKNKNNIQENYLQYLNMKNSINILNNLKLLINNLLNINILLLNKSKSILLSNHWSSLIIIEKSWSDLKIINDDTPTSMYKFWFLKNIKTPKRKYIHKYILIYVILYENYRYLLKILNKNSHIFNFIKNTLLQKHYIFFEEINKFII